MALAVLGGSFDPVHNGHVAMARHVLDLDLAQEVMVVPAGRSPFKDCSTAESKHRLAMARLAFADFPQTRVNDLELLRPGPSYMVETLEELAKIHPECSLKLIIGADNVGDFFQWQRAADILDLARVLVLGRQGQGPQLPDELSSSFQLVPDFDQRVSSTEIRVMLASGKSVAHLVPATVLAYLTQYNLYR